MNHAAHGGIVNFIWAIADDVPRDICARQVPRCDPADDGDSPARCLAGAGQAGCAGDAEAGEHFTPRDVVKLMADLIFLPVAEAIESGSYLVYDGARGRAAC